MGRLVASAAGRRLAFIALGVTLATAATAGTLADHHAHVVEAQLAREDAFTAALAEGSTRGFSYTVQLQWNSKPAAGAFFGGYFSDASLDGLQDRVQAVASEMGLHAPLCATLTGDALATATARSAPTDTGLVCNLYEVDGTPAGHVDGWDEGDHLVRFVAAFGRGATVRPIPAITLDQDTS